MGAGPTWFVRNHRAEDGAEAFTLQGHAASEQQVDE
jgi:hypothetical protein